MALVLVSPRANSDLNELIATHNLPANTRERVKARLRRLADFPQTGQKLSGNWEGFRYTLGPWRWMLIVFLFDEEADEVIVATIQDSRSARAVTAERG
jgi:plasmid stabilization system protein ParE